MSAAVGAFLGLLAAVVVGVGIIIVVLAASAFQFSSCSSGSSRRFRSGRSSSCIAAVAVVFTAMYYVH